MARNTTIKDQTTTSACKTPHQIKVQTEVDLLSEIEKCKSDIASMQTRIQQMNSQSSNGLQRNNANVQQLSNNYVAQQNNTMGMLSNIFQINSEPYRVFNINSYIKKSSDNQNTKFVHNFLWDEPILFSEKDGIATITTSGIKFNHKLDKEYYKLSVEQWNYGSNQILLDMMSKQQITTQGIKDYLLYQKSVNRPFRKHMRKSVLLYDHEYRELQHTENFNWNTHQPNLHEFNLLVEPNYTTVQVLHGNQFNTSVPAKTEMLQKQRKRGPFPKDGKEICLKFNGAFYDNCSMKAVFIPGKYNTIADACSRLHKPGYLSQSYSVVPTLTFETFTDGSKVTEPRQQAEVYKSKVWANSTATT
ncbi:hypothetical protein KUTeg_021611 [Tegillarca granosa]|uniref:Uncharacterized protein n=1 Tax=Tegillarca granosa TaxID=220873 RepID=A0ABQ9E880_TEGGR|nr:hypothetical protein KUTeg_021611 [Tegillarca granosa]